MLQYK